MSEYIFFPVISSYNGEYFTRYDEAEHKNENLAFPIDKIREIKDILEPNAKERTYCDGCLTEIIMESGRHYVTHVKSTDIKDKINELEGVEKKENKKII